MKKLVALFVTLSLLALAACEKGPSEIDIRAEQFAKQDFTEASVRKAISGFFDGGSFKINSIIQDGPGSVKIDADTGSVQDKRALLLRAAAASYTFSRILMMNEKAERVEISYAGALKEKDGKVMTFDVITTEMTKELAAQVAWDSLETFITRDRDFDKALAEFNIIQFDKAFEEVTKSQLFHKVNDATAK